MPRIIGRCVGLVLALTAASLLLNGSAAQGPGKKEEPKVAPEVQAWIKTLTEKMTDPQPAIRDSARAGLVAIGRPALPALKELANGKDAAAATAARQVIARIENTTDVTAIANALFDKYANGKDVLIIADYPSSRNPQSKENLEAWAKSHNITNGQLTREQFAEYMKDRLGNFMPGDPRPRGPAVEPPRNFDKDAEDSFRRHDREDTGKLKPDEGPRWLQDEWELWDKGGKGFLDLSDYKEAYKAHQLGGDPRDLPLDGALKDLDLSDQQSAKIKELRAAQLKAERARSRDTMKKYRDALAKDIRAVLSKEQLEQFDAAYKGSYISKGEVITVVMVSSFFEKALQYLDLTDKQKATIADARAAQLKRMYDAFGKVDDAGNKGREDMLKNIKAVLNEEQRAMFERAYKDALPPRDADKEAEASFRRLDKKSEGKLTPDDMLPWLKDVWQKWDKGGKGFLDLADYKEAYKARLKALRGESK